GPLAGVSNRRPQRCLWHRYRNGDRGESQGVRRSSVRHRGVHPASWRNRIHRRARYRPLSQAGDAAVVAVRECGGAAAALCGSRQPNCVSKESFMSEVLTVTHEVECEIALVWLSRPDNHTCFSPTVMKQVRAAIDRAGEEAKCGIIFGHGDNFCAGLVLRWAAESWKTGRSQRLPFQFNRNSYFEVMARGDIPFIAALHGATLGGGLETAAAAHIRVADETAYFALPEGTRGIFIGGRGSLPAPP